MAVTGADHWMLPIVHEVLASTRYGGGSFREQVQAGEADFTDDDYVASIEVVQDAQAYFPDDVSGVSYTDSQVLFTTGKAALIVGYLWSLILNPRCSSSSSPPSRSSQGSESETATWLPVATLLIATLVMVPAGASGSTRADAPDSARADAPGSARAAEPTSEELDLSQPDPLGSGSPARAESALRHASQGWSGGRAPRDDGRRVGRRPRAVVRHAAVPRRGRPRHAQRDHRGPQGIRRGAALCRRRAKVAAPSSACQCARTRSSTLRRSLSCSPRSPCCNWWKDGALDLDAPVAGGHR